MKNFCVLIVLISALSCNAEEKKKPLPTDKLGLRVDETKTVTAEKKEEDCDDKAKKPIEIKEETISLSGNTGCSLDEVKP